MANVEFLRPPTEEEGLQSRRARATQHVHEAIRSGDSSLRNLPVFLKEALETEAWKDRPTPLGKIVSNASFSDWLVEKYPHGVGASYDIVRNLLRDDAEALSLLDKAMQRGAGNPTGANQHTKDGSGTVNNVNNSSRPTGNTVDAGLRRLRKAASSDEKAADLLRRVEAKELSTNSACIEMGWRKKTVTLPDEPEALSERAAKQWGALAVIKRLLPRLTDEEREELRDLLAQKELHQ